MGFDWLTILMNKVIGSERAHGSVLTNERQGGICWGFWEGTAVIGGSWEKGLLVFLLL
jgi:hypothetical protein